MRRRGVRVSSSLTLTGIGNGWPRVSSSRATLPSRADGGVNSIRTRSVREHTRFRTGWLLTKIAGSPSSAACFASPPPPPDGAGFGAANAAISLRRRRPVFPPRPDDLAGLVPHLDFPQAAVALRVRRVVAKHVIRGEVVANAVDAALQIVGVDDGDTVGFVGERAASRRSRAPAPVEGGQADGACRPPGVIG